MHSNSIALILGYGCEVLLNNKWNSSDENKIKGVMVKVMPIRDNNLNTQLS